MVPDAEVYAFFGLREDIKDEEKQMMHKATQAAKVRCLLRPWLRDEQELLANPPVQSHIPWTVWLKVSGWHLLPFR